MPARSLRDAISTNGGQQIAPRDPRLGGEYGRNVSGQPSPRGENFVLGLLRSANLPGTDQRAAQQQHQPTAQFDLGAVYDHELAADPNQTFEWFRKAAKNGDAVPGAAMTDPTREEFDAKLATVEARTETRFVELSGKIDRVADSINALTSAVTTVKAEVTEESKTTRWTIGVTIVASMIAFAGALWVTQGNLLSAFQTGL